MADSITTIIAKAIHKGRSDIPWEASASQDTAYRDARSAMSAMPHPSERHAAEVGEDADAIERLHLERNRFRGALLQIKYAAEDGRICDDVAWFSQHETLFDYIEGTLETAQAAVGDLFQGALRDCPFCGGKAIRRDDPGVPDVPFGLVVDHQPGCFLGFRDLQPDAVIDAAWNARASAARALLSDEAVAWVLEVDVDGQGIAFARHDLASCPTADEAMQFARRRDADQFLAHVGDRLEGFYVAALRHDQRGEG